MNAEEFLRFHVEKIIRENELKGKLKPFFPDTEYRPSLIPTENGNEILKRKQVEGLGVFLYYSRQGKRQFHEYLLDYITDELKKQGIRFKRSRKNIGADLEIGKIRIELEVRSDPSKQPENRSNLIKRLRRHPETTIIIVLNQKDKTTYLHSKAREIIISNNRFLTIPEFLQKIRYLQDHIF